MERRLRPRYESDGEQVVQVHPVHGRRPLIRADGHGQLVWVGEVAGSLLVFERWSCMGYKDGSLRVLDPDTLALKAFIALDLDAVGVVGFDAGGRFVLSECRAGEATWRAWHLDDWRETTPPPADPGAVERLESRLACALDLPRAGGEQEEGA
jgi:hypothetical protein